MEPWLDKGVWERVARELRQHRQAGFGAILTEDVLRFSTGRALGATGCEPTTLTVERPHPAIAGSRPALVVGEPARSVIEF